eukprot:GHRQ01026293.1.p1 GENE.GHRQ01026293.1~~GHRQ01026293.1.p1  ORF type:complete len:270 (+),score=24.72 GHRQ01026293.1:53-862(+)
MINPIEGGQVWGYGLNGTNLRLNCSSNLKPQMCCKIATCRTAARLATQQTWDRKPCAAHAHTKQHPCELLSVQQGETACTKYGPGDLALTVAASSPSSRFIIRPASQGVGDADRAHSTVYCLSNRHMLMVHAQRNSSPACRMICSSTGCTLLSITARRMSPTTANKPACASSGASASNTATAAGERQQQQQLRYALAIHGGAGVINTSNSVWISSAMEGLQAALEAGHAVLRAGGSAADAAVASVEVMENDPHFNAGEALLCKLVLPAE